MISLLRNRTVGISALVLSLALSATLASAKGPVERTNTTTLWFEGWGDLSNATLVISGPDNFSQEIYSEKKAPTFLLRDAAPVKDGVYRYELSAATSERIEVRNKLNNGRGKAQRNSMAKPFNMGGFFIVDRGVIAEKKDIVEK